MLLLINYYKRLNKLYRVNVNRVLVAYYHLRLIYSLHLKREPSKARISLHLELNCRLTVWKDRR